MKNNKKLLPILIVIGVVLISIGATLAFINYSKNGQTENTIRLGNLTFHYEEGNRSISILDALPVDSDDDAKSSNDYFDFRITANTTFAEIPYVITGRLSEDSDLDPSVVKVYLTRVSGNSETQLLYTTLDQLENKTFLNNGFVDKVLYRDTVPVNGSSYEVNYRLRLWIAEDTNFATGLYNNKRLSLTVNVYTNEGQSLTNEHITSPDDTSLKMISANGMYLLTPSSDEGVDYEATVPAEVNTVSFDVTEKNILATSTVTEIGQTLTMGNVRRMSSQSGTFNLLTGDNYYRVRTTSADNTKTKDYIIKIEKELSRDNNLSYLGVTGYAFDETFDETGNDTTYHITMEGNTIVLEGNNNGGATIEGLGEKELVWGENTFTITVTPENPNEEPKTYTIVVNNVRPEEPSITGGTGDLWVSTDSTITIGESGSAISGISGYEYLITTNANLTVNDNTQATGTLTTSPYSLPITNEGTSYIYYRTVSEDGNKSEWSNRITVHKDSVAPTNVTITASDSKASGSWHAKNTTLSVSATKSGASDLTYYFGTNSNPSTVASGTTLSTVDETGTTYYAKACNQAGICSSVVNYTANVAEYLKDLILADKASTKDIIIPDSELKYKSFMESSSQYQNGLFKAPDTDGGYTYYSRGNLGSSPLILIGDYSWLLVRINGNNTLRLLAQGIEKDAVITNNYLPFIMWNRNPTNATRASVIWKSTSSSMSDAYYSNTGTEGAKKNLETWYDTFIKNDVNYKDIVTTGTYCQALKVKYNAGTGALNKPLPANYVPSYDCPMNDGYVNNGKLTLEVGLLSLDEFLMAGGKIQLNSGGYSFDYPANAINYISQMMSSMQDAWTMTPVGGRCISSGCQTSAPSSYSSYGVYTALANGSSVFADSSSATTAKLIPVINIKADTLAIRKTISTRATLGLSDWPGYQVVQ